MSQPQPSDDDLIAACQDGSARAALDQLVERHWRGVRATIYAMILNDADADDLSQEVFARVIRGLASFRREAKFSTWLYATTMNTVRSFLGRPPRAQAAADDELSMQVDGRHGGPETAAMAGELDEEIAAALGSLPRHLRAAMALVAMQGLGIREAAKAEGCAVPTMYWRLHKARKLLRKRLDKYLRGKDEMRDEG
jgi:RNA polymerase sigma-70 factor, ECF subfamily